MDNNSVSIRAYLTNGELREVLESGTPAQALHHLLPGTSADVQELILKVRTRDGRVVSLYINQQRVEATILGVPERHRNHSLAGRE
jgi:hypothetical protein